MSGRRRELPPDELEVHRVLSPSGSNTTVSAKDNLPPPVQASKASKSLSDSQIKDFKGMFKSMGDLMAKITQSGILNALDSENEENDENVENNESDENNEFVENNESDDINEYEDTDEDESHGQDSRIKFGLVNEPISGAAASEDAPPLSMATQTQVDDNNNNSVHLDHSYDKKKVETAASPSETAPLNAPVPDAGLPSLSLRPPLNWQPDLEVLAWAVETLDLCEWSKEDRDVFAKKYSPSPEHDHIFKAVENPPDLLNVIRSPDVAASDFLFKRAVTEQFLYDANKDLACGFRPLIDLLSSLKGKDMEHIRIPLAHVFQSMSSAINNISKGRRELGRRFVPLDSAPALFRSKPSHHCLFGFGSLEEAMTKTVEAKKINKDLVFVPKKVPFKNSGQGRQLGRLYKYNPRYNNSYYNSYQSHNNNRGKFFRGRGGQKKTRRGSGKGPRSSKASNNTNSNSGK